MHTVVCHNPDLYQSLRFPPGRIYDRIFPFAWGGLYLGASSTLDAPRQMTDGPTSNGLRFSSCGSGL